MTLYKINEDLRLYPCNERLTPGLTSVSKPLNALLALRYICFVISLFIRFHFLPYSFWINLIAIDLISTTPLTMQSQIREVWSDNLDAELDILRELIDRYPYVSMVSSLVIDVGDVYSNEYRTPNFQVS